MTMTFSLWNYRQEIKFNQGDESRFIVINSNKCIICILLLQIETIVVRRESNQGSGPVYNSPRKNLGLT